MPGEYTLRDHLSIRQIKERFRTTTVLFEDVAVDPFIKANQQSLPLQDGRRPEIAGGPQQVFQQNFFIGPVVAHVKPGCLPAFHGNNDINLFGQPERIYFLEDILVSNNGGGDLDIVLCKKLLRFTAGLSTIAMIIPVNYGHIHTPSD